MKRLEFMKRIIVLTAMAASLAVACLSCVSTAYKGTPYEDAEFKGGAQHIPGSVLCACYDLGGEGIAYHDTTPQNHGSGELNPLDGSYLHGFRVDESVDTSYTKSDGTDNSAYNLVTPPMELLYVGWTEPGEWTKYTVEVDSTGEYAVSLLYTSNSGGTVALDVNDTPVLSDVPVASTYDANDSLAWRQWHHWNRAPLGRVSLKKGGQTLTLRTVTEGQMNYARLDFELQ